MNKTNNDTSVLNSLKENNLTGKLLVYIGDTTDELYNQSVVYIAESSSNGTKGIIINKLLFNTATIECNRSSSDNTAEKEYKNVYEDLYQGGPENPAHGFVLFPKDDYLSKDPNAKINGDIAISSSFGILQEILDGVGPNSKIIAMGHCKWEPGELEWELFNNKWLIVKSDVDLMFHTSLSKRWEKAKELSSIDMRSYIRQSGTA
ncbi:MAG: YqgE/AlgH family protein [Alphaproteobacteria bacterium]|nr:YqgE/AlgH family protein [Alphaproteobacteria bacterium]